MVDAHAFRGFTEGEWRYLTGGSWKHGKWRVSGTPKKPYYVAFQEVVIRAVEAVKRPRMQAHFYFDENKQLSSVAQRLYVQIKQDCEDPVFVSKMGETTQASSFNHPRLQAADLITYCWYQFGEHGKGAKKEVLGVMDVLAPKGDEVMFFTKETMEKLLGRRPMTDGRTMVP